MKYAIAILLIATSVHAGSSANWSRGGGGPSDYEYSFHVTKDGTQSVTNAVDTTLTWDVESWDIGGGFNLAENRFYRINVQVYGGLLPEFAH